MALNNRQQLFITEYLRTFNATTAYQTVYPDVNRATAAVNGCRYLKNKEIAAAISLRMNESAMSADEVLMRLAEQARGDIGDYLRHDPTTDDVLIDLPKAIEAQKTRLIKKLTQKRTTRTMKDDSEIEEIVTSIEMYDAQGALGWLGKKHGLFVERSEVTGKDGGPIETTDATFTDEQRAARIAAIFEAARARRDRQATEGGSDNMAPAAGTTD